MRFYTKTGDGGETGLIGGQRVAKHDARVSCYGVVDELNAALGWVAVVVDDQECAALREIQSDLFILGAQLATADSVAATASVAPAQRIGADRVDALEAQLDTIGEQLPAMKNFVLPGGGEAAARLHLARTVCRRAERDVVSLAQTRHVDPTIIKYLNRLSDLLFAKALDANRRDGVADIPWIAPKNNLTNNPTDAPQP